MAVYRITCINLSHTGRTHEHITHVSNPGVWTSRLTVAQVINLILGPDQHTFYVQDAAGNRANVMVVDANPRYIRTRKDNTWTDNLLSLTSCPI
jgi:hypothetical protein